MMMHLEQRGGQSFDTLSDPWDNKLPVYNFKETLPIELRIKYLIPNSKWFNSVAVYHNWLQSGNTYLILGWVWNIKFSPN
mgnify:FL=1